MKSFIAILIPFLAIASALNLPEGNNATNQAATSKGYSYETKPSINSKCHQVNGPKSPGQPGKPRESDQSGQPGQSGELGQSGESGESGQPGQSGESGQSGYY